MPYDEDQLAYWQNQKAEIIQRKADYTKKVGNSSETRTCNFAGMHAQIPLFSVVLSDLLPRAEYNWHSPSQIPDAIKNSSLKQKCREIIGKDNCEIELVAIKGLYKIRHGKNKLDDMTVTFRYQEFRQEFDQEAYNKALRQCEEKIQEMRQESSQAKIRLAQQRAREDEEARLAQQKAREAEEAKATIARLEQTTQLYNNQARQAEQETIHLQQRATAAVSQIAKLEQQLADPNSTYNQGQKKNAEDLKKIKEQLAGLTQIQRAEFLSKLYTNSDHATTISAIQELGFDRAYLAEKAYKTNNLSLLQFALQYGSDCANTAIGEETLLQKMLNSGREAMVKAELARNHDLSNTLMLAVSNNDTATIERLFVYDNQLVKHKTIGYTLLHLAISCINPHPEMVKRLLTLDPAAAKISTDKGESTLQLAVRHCNQEIIELVASHVDIVSELQVLGLDDEDLIKQITETKDTKKLIELWQETVTLSKIGCIFIESSKDGDNEITKNLGETENIDKL